MDGGRQGRQWRMEQPGPDQWGWAAQLACLVVWLAEMVLVWWLADLVRR